jgi:AcrR family transcriptional regulator
MIPRPKAERPAKTPLSRQQIVDAALRIVKTEGVDGVSMRRLAAEFSTGPSSLYAHVANKNELLALMFDAVCGLVEVPPLDPAHWREQLQELARACHRVLVDHYDLAGAALATIPSGPNALRVSDAMLGMMLAGGVPPQIAGWAMDRIFLYLTSDAYEMSIWRASVIEAGGEKESFIGQLEEDLTAFFEQLDPEVYPHVQAHARDLVGGGAGARFELGLELLIGGLDRYTDSR